ncbi:hypothetical protein J8273_3012 [Carpediemonas membranifera]|uniref:Uncharacterized protein n=1 Tax=Carpediemonas membranifera TaxID=201153 RepID=A0A8J6AZX4_9EUKA|nr:hypothetical protein J8273_3012 [Carpediemonas membranifera]|eukprot:KAG9395445.1 hypothetical protein J8273_3012 [Carpediemonas membranifera]
MFPGRFKIANQNTFHRVSPKTTVPPSISSSSASSSRKNTFSSLPNEAFRNEPSSYEHRMSVDQLSQPAPSSLNFTRPHPFDSLVPNNAPSSLPADTTSFTPPTGFDPTSPVSDQEDSYLHMRSASQLDQADVYGHEFQDSYQDSDVHDTLSVLSGANDSPRRQSTVEEVNFFIDDAETIKDELCNAITHARRRRGYPTVWLYTLSEDLRRVARGELKGIRRPRGFISSQMKRFDYDNMKTEDIIADIIEDPMVTLPMDIPEKAYCNLHFAVGVTARDEHARVLIAALYCRAEADTGGVAIALARDFPTIPGLPSASPSPSPESTQRSSSLQNTRQPQPYQYSAQQQHSDTAPQPARVDALVRTPTRERAPSIPVVTSPDSKQTSPELQQPYHTHDEPLSPVVSAQPDREPEPYPYPQHTSPLANGVTVIGTEHAAPAPAQLSSHDRDIQSEIATMRAQLEALEMEFMPSDPPSLSSTMDHTATIRTPTQPKPTGPGPATMDQSKSVRRELVDVVETVRVGLDGLPTQDEMTHRVEAVERQIKTLAGLHRDRLEVLAGIPAAQRIGAHGDVTMAESALIDTMDPSGLDAGSSARAGPNQHVDSRLERYASLLAALVERPDTLAHLAQRTTGTTRERVLALALFRVANHDLAPPQRAVKVVTSVASLALPQQLLLPPTSIPDPSSALTVALRHLAQRSDVMGFLRVGLDQALSDIAADTVLPMFKANLESKNFACLSQLKSVSRLCAEAVTSRHSRAAIPAVISDLARSLLDLITNIAPSDTDIVLKIYRACFAYILFVAPAESLLAKLPNPGRANARLVLELVAAAALPVGSTFAFQSFKDAPWIQRLHPLIEAIRPAMEAFIDDLTRESEPSLLNACPFAGNTIVVTAADLVFLHRTLAAHGDIPVLPGTMRQAMHALGPSLPSAPVRRSECPVYVVDVPLNTPLPAPHDVCKIKKLLIEAPSIVDRLDTVGSDADTANAQRAVRALSTMADSIRLNTAMYDALGDLTQFLNRRADRLRNDLGDVRLTQRASIKDTTLSMTPQATPTMTIGPVSQPLARHTLDLTDTPGSTPVSTPAPPMADPQPNGNSFIVGMTLNSVPDPASSPSCPGKPEKLTRKSRR